MRLHLDLDSTRGVACALFAVSLLIQTFSASFLVPVFSTPNPSSAVARNLANEGVFTSGNLHRLHGPDPPPEGETRAFMLPGEVMYQAAALAALPEWALRYIHVPFTSLLLAAAGVLACLLGGSRLGLATGLVGNVQPFIVLHGPTWDDIFLSTALDTAIVALLAVWSRSPDEFSKRLAGKAVPVSLLAITVAAGFSVVTRSQSRVTLGLLAIVILAVPSLRRLLPGAVALAAGMAVALISWGARNDAVLGQFETGSTHDGITLWESNYPHAWEAVVTGGQVESLNEIYMVDDFAAARELSEVDANAYYTRRAVRHILANPVSVLWTGIRKAGVTLTGWAPPMPILGARNLVGIVSNVVLLALAALGARLLWPQRWTPEVQLIALYAAISFSVVSALMILGPVGLRYRLGVDWLLWMAAAAALLRVHDRVCRS
jgi:hypothetical protein